MPFWLKVLNRLIVPLPTPHILSLGKGLGWVVGCLFRYRWKESQAALMRCFPEKPEEEVRSILRSMYKNLGMSLLETLFLLSKGIDAYKNSYRIFNQHLVDEALKLNKGALILTAHIGNWELAGFLVAKLGYRISAIVKEIKNPQLNHFWSSVRNRNGVETLASRHSFHSALRALKKNRLLVFLIDQNMTRKKGVFVKFFGRWACTTPGLAYLAAVSKAPVLPAYSLRNEDGSIQVVFLPALEPPPDRKKETILAATQLYTKVVEDLVRKHPDQWIWLHRRWRTQPKGTSNQHLTSGLGSTIKGPAHDHAGPITNL